MDRIRISGNTVGWIGETFKAFQDGPDLDIAIRRMDERDWSVYL